MPIGNETITGTQYASEVIALYERKQTMFRGTVRTKGDLKGNSSFVFIIGPAADMAVQRGANGDIPTMPDNQTSATCTLEEYHHLAEKTQFNIYSSPVDQRQVMQEQGIVSNNKRTDDLIIDQLDTTAYNTGAASAATAVGWLLAGIKTLGDNDVPCDDGKIWCALTPAAHAQLMRVDRLTSSDYVDDRPFMKQQKIRDILGAKVFKSTALPNKGTADATCFIWHEDAVGHCTHMAGNQTDIGYESKHDRSWARTSTYQGAKMLQDEGVVELHHNDTTALV